MIKAKKAKTVLSVIIALTMCVCFLGACGEKEDLADKTVVTYDLNGGIYRSCELPFRHYYGIEEGESRLIFEPSTLSNEKVERSGYEFEGWFTGSKTGDEISFGSQWDFASDTVSTEGVTLFAKWKKIGTYNYVLCYTDEESGETVELGKYPVSENEKFPGDYNKFAAGRTGYTPIPEYYDESGAAWHDDYQMEPSEDGKRDVKIFIKYIEGNFALCGSVNELRTAVRNNRNIYLTADIDLRGEKFGGFGSNGNFTRKFYGNGFTIKNFVVETYFVTKDAEIDDRDSYRMALFGNANGAHIENVNFSGVKFIVDAGKSTIKKIVISPICIKSSKTTIKNVKFDGVYEVSKLPSGITEDSESFVVVSGTEAYYVATDSANVVENVDCKFIKDQELDSPNQD